MNNQKKLGNFITLIFLVQKEYYNRTMDDLSPSELKKTVKLQFSKRCGNFEQILSHMSEDFIARYSGKSQPHPDFFKEDAALALKQFTLYSDQCIQGMKKFVFMESPAQILSTLITSLLKVNEYLAKQVYHYLTMERPQHVSHITDTLCSSCSKMRQNEKVRALRQELNLNKTEVYAPKVIREVVTRKGQKYDVEQLLQEELQSLESLNQDQVRKRLGKLQLDHDRRRQEMIVCIQELARANERVTGYSKAIDKKGKDQGRFDIKEYVFQISRHFYHNISSLDQKIKQLKQGLNPMVDAQSQTSQQIILMSLHQEMVNLYKDENENSKSTMRDLQSKLVIQQRKCKQQSDTCQILQQKLRTIELQKEQSKINEKVTQTQLKGVLAQYQSKTQNLQKIVKKLKTTTKFKDIEPLDDQQQNKRSKSIKLQNKSEINIQNSFNQSEGLSEKQQKKTLKSCLALKKTEIKHNLLNARLQEKINQLKESKRGNSGYINDVAQSIESIYCEMHQQNKERLKLHRVLDEVINLHFVKKEVGNDKQSRDRMSLYNIQLKNIRSSCQEKYPLSKNSQNDRNSQSEYTSKLQKLTIVKMDKKTKFQRLSSIKAKENIIFPEYQNIDCFKNDESEGKQFSVFDPQRTKLQLKKSVEMIRSKANFRLNPDVNPKQKQRKKDFGQFQIFKKKARKRRNLSQQNSLDEKDQIENFRRSIDKLVTKEINLFLEEDNKALFSLKNSQYELKTTKKSLYKPQTHKTVLSLQEINYSTYFYSLIAKLHVKNPVAYVNLKKMLSIIPGQGNEEDGVKNSLNALISNHRKCKGNGSICSHLQHFLEKVRNL